MKPNKFIYLKCSETSFFRMYLEMLTPFHKLASREKDVAAKILAQYFRLKDNIPDPEVLKEVLWSSISRKDMRESLGMSHAFFQQILAKLKSVGFIQDGGIGLRFLPPAPDKEAKRFTLAIVYDWSSEKDVINAQKPAG